MTNTPQARIAEALKPHSWYVKTDADGSLHGVCLGCFENGVLPQFDTWHEFAAHLAAVVSALPEIAIVERVRSCDCSGTCATNIHVHGCFADTGACDDPRDHVTAAYHRGAGGGS